MSNSLWLHGLTYPPGSSVHGILQARILEWVAVPFSRVSSQHRNQTQVSCTADTFFFFLPSESPRKPRSIFTEVSVQFSRLVVSDSLWPHRPQHARLPCPSPTPGAYSNSCPLSWWCHPAISSSVIPFSSCPQSLPASGSFQMSQFFSSGGQSIGVSASASVLQMNIQDWFPLGWTGWISLQARGLSRVFSNTTVQNHHFFGTQLSL